MSLHPIPDPVAAIRELIHWVGEHDPGRAVLLDQVVHELVEARVSQMPLMTTPQHPSGAPLREELGRMVREAWLEWAQEQPQYERLTHPDWLLPWEELSPGMQEVDRRIGEELFVAGVEAERNAPQAARVWGPLDPQPPRNTWYLDKAGDVEQHNTLASHEWLSYVKTWGPLVEVFVPDYETAVAEDAGRRQVIEPLPYIIEGT